MPQFIDHLIDDVLPALLESTLDKSAADELTWLAFPSPTVSGAITKVTSSVVPLASLAWTAYLSGQVSRHPLGDPKTAALFQISFCTPDTPTQQPLSHLERYSVGRLQSVKNRDDRFLAESRAAKQIFL
jgi:hypothetical protein